MTAPGKELARTARTVVVIEERERLGKWPAVGALIVKLPPPLTAAETVTAFVPLPPFNWHKWVFDVADAVHDGDVDTVRTLLDLGLRKGFA